MRVLWLPSSFRDDGPDLGHHLAALAAIPRQFPPQNQQLNGRLLTVLPTC